MNEPRKTPEDRNGWFCRIPVGIRRGLPTDSPKTTHGIARRWTLVRIIVMVAVAESGVLVKGLPVWEQVFGEVPEDALVVEVNSSGQRVPETKAKYKLNDSAPRPHNEDRG